jgi:hypothetical protein
MDGRSAAHKSAIEVAKFTVTEKKEGKEGKEA